MKNKTFYFLVVTGIVFALLVVLYALKNVQKYNSQALFISSQKNTQPIENYSTSSKISVPQTELTVTYPGKFKLNESKRIFSQATVASFDFSSSVIENKNIVFPANIAFFTPQSIQKYQENCSKEVGLVEKPCLQKEYFNKTVAQAIKDNLIAEKNYGDFIYTKIGSVGYMVKQLPCEGDICFNRMYITFKNDVRVELTVIVFDQTMQKEADKVVSQIVVE